MTRTTDRADKAPPRRFSRYPEYAHSGLEWLGPVPSHWDVKKTKFAATLRSGHTPSRQNPEYWKDCTIPWFGLADVGQIRAGRVEYVYGTVEKISEIGLANSAARLLPKGTVILSRTASVGFSAILGVDMATTQDFVNWVCRPSLRPEYLLYVFRAMEPEFGRVTMGSTHQTVYMPDVGRFTTPVPPIPEQDRIVAFIRKETSRIDGLVAQKERLIELLQEKRTAIITRAVTRGLDPNVPMKDSGVEWLGKVPAHWEQARLWRLCSAVSGGTPTKDNPVYWNGKIPWVSPKDMKRRLISTSRDLITERAVEEASLRLIEPRAVLIVVRGMILAHSFPVAVTTAPVTINQDMKALRLVDRIDTSYFAWTLDGLARGIVATVVEEAAHGTRAIRMGQWRNVVCPVPPYAEQRAIAHFLDRTTAKADVLVAKVRDATSHLKELRTALISAAVTGKIDVRHYRLARPTG